MTKLKNSLLSLSASGRLTRILSFKKRFKVSIVERTPAIDDVKSPGQLAWRHMYQKCSALWHTLSYDEKARWESLARCKHMTGFAYWQSQCLKPNPGIYLPLQGGTMQGDIDMDKHRVLKLPLPTDAQEAASKKYHDDNLPVAAYTEGARVYNSVDLEIGHNSWTYLTFDTERYDTDAIHNTIANTHYLVCNTAGIYIASLHVTFAANPAGERLIQINHSILAGIARQRAAASDIDETSLSITTICKLTVGQFLLAYVYQSSGDVLDVKFLAAYSPEFMMQRIG